MDYSKWDKIADDSDEEPESRQRARESIQQEQVETLRELQEEIDRWLRKSIGRLPRDGMNPLGAPSSIGVNERTPPPPMRTLAKSEREVLAMLVALSDFEEGETNLDRHPLMLDLIRHNRWLEEDPGTLEVLCRIHHQAMREAGEKNIVVDPVDQRMRNAIMCGINTLAAPKRAKCPGGLLDLFTKICTPATEEAKELRKKWQTKEFGKDALFDSLFPDLRAYNDMADKDSEGFGDIWIIVILGVLTILGIAAFVIFFYTSNNNKTSKGNKLANSSNASAIINATAAAVSAAGAALGAAGGSVGGDASQTEPTATVAPSSPLASDPKGAEL